MRASLLLAAALALAGCQQVPVASTSNAAPAPSAAPAPRASAWHQFVEGFVEADFREEPQRGVRAGRHEFDGQVEDVTPAALDRRIARLHADRARATGFDAASLTPDERFERDYLLWVIDDELFGLEVARQPYRNPVFYAPAMSPDVYLEREYAPLPQRLAAFVKYERALPALTRQVRENLQPPLQKTYIQVGHIIVGGLANHFEKDVTDIFAAVTDEKLKADLKESNAGAIAALKELDTWLQDQLPTATQEFALGAEAFKRMLHDTEGVDIPLPVLWEMGERDVERNIATLKDACARVIPGVPIRGCLERIQGRKPQEGPVRAATAQLGELRKFIEQNHVVGIPSTEEVVVHEAPPHQRFNSAYITTPGPYEKGLPSIFNIAPPDPAWGPEEQRAYIPDRPTLLFLTIHEVWPGRFLQHLYAERAPSQVGRIYRSNAFTEGWAHYAEELMLEDSFGRGDPALTAVQVSNALLRDVRYLCAIGMHTADMTVTQCEAMFRERAFQDPASARQQAARGTVDPAYLNNTLGKLLIRELREEWTAKHGGRASWQAFHDKLLSYGSPPLPLVRKAMMAE
ncbi:MAG TPA: DUF885 domain-containing protein [Usitatibacter sp.]|nr:DUF885 domain-containing protein [Usitatibacter sp.]